MLTSDNENTVQRAGENPRVSVIIPAYNTAHYIAETLDSVFAQTYRDFEVIVINDGTPDTEMLERVLRPYLDRIIYVKQENRGLSGARNTGIRRARGKYLAFLDSDEAWEPDYLAEQIKILEQKPDFAAVYCDVLHYWDSIEISTTFMTKCPSHGPVTFESLLREDCHIPVSDTVVTKQTVVDAGLFDERLRRVEDHDLWLRALHRGAKITYHNKVLGRARLRPDSLSASKVAMLETFHTVLTRLLASLKLSPARRGLLEWKIAETRALWDLERGKDAIRKGQFRDASEAFESANRFLGRTRLRAVLIGLRIAPRLTARVAIALDRRREKQERRRTPETDHCC